MKDYLYRLKKEQQELEERMSKISRACNIGFDNIIHDIKPAIPEEDLYLLGIQYNIMEAYDSILQRRIRIAEEKR